MKPTPPKTAARRRSDAGDTAIQRYPHRRWLCRSIPESNERAAPRQGVPVIA